MLQEAICLQIPNQIIETSNQHKNTQIQLLTGLEDFLCSINIFFLGTSIKFLEFSKHLSFQGGRELRQFFLHPFQEFLLSVTKDDVTRGLSNLHHPVITAQNTTVHAVNVTHLEKS